MPNLDTAIKNATKTLRKMGYDFICGVEIEHFLHTDTIDPETDIESILERTYEICRDNTDEVNNILETSSFLRKPINFEMGFRKFHESIEENELSIPLIQSRDNDMLKNLTACMFLQVICGCIEKKVQLERVYIENRSEESTNPDSPYDYSALHVEFCLSPKDPLTTLRSEKILRQQIDLKSKLLGFAPHQGRLDGIISTHFSFSSHDKEENIFLSKADTQTSDVFGQRISRLVTKATKAMKLSAEIFAESLAKNMGYDCDKKDVKLGADKEDSKTVVRYRKDRIETTRLVGYDNLAATMLLSLDATLGAVKQLDKSKLQELENMDAKTFEINRGEESQNTKPKKNYRTDSAQLIKKSIESKNAGIT